MLDYDGERALVRHPTVIPASPGRSMAAGVYVIRRWMEWLPFAAVVLLSFALNAWGASKSGYGNTYYAAAVRSMTLSWKNFFFGAFDPGGFITVDKPPAFLWIGALSAHIFGYSTWSIMLPSAVAGAASVALLWLIIRRSFGVMAATIAAAVLALTPISVAVNRLNFPEPFMILALVGAAGAVLRSLDSRRWWIWVVIAGTLVGVAFNVKMFAAWIPGPALALALVVATRSLSWSSARQLLLRLVVLAATTLAVSGSWILIVDSWPASARPYIGGSTDNTALDLALGYNGFGRVDGTDQLGPGGGGARGGTPPAGFPGSPAPAGTPGLFRLFDAANGGQIAWLLPFALGTGLVALWGSRRDPARRAAAVLFLGWVGLYGGVFSYAQGIFHSYYTSAMAPGIAALVGIGAVATADAIKRDRRWLLAALGLLAVTAWAQLQLAGRTPDFYGWVRPLTVAVVLAGAVALVVLAVLRKRAVVGGLAVALAGLLLIPAAWSVSVSATPSLHSMVPEAGEQQGASGRTFGSAPFDSGTAQLAAWLRAHTDSNATWQLVVSSAQNASPLISEYNISVMAIGGFSGGDNSITVGEFAALVESGAVRYVLVSNRGPDGGGPGPGDGGVGTLNGAQASAGPNAPGLSGATGGTSSANAVMSAVRSAGTAVSDPGLPTQYQGQLYDVSGAADALRALVR